MNSILPAAALITFSSLGFISCDKRTPESASTDNINTTSTSDLAPDVSKEVDRVHSFIAASLPSYFSVASPEPEERIVNERTRRVVVRLPIVAEEDLYRDAKNGEFFLVEKVVSKGNSKSAVVVLTATKTNDQWIWQEQVEVAPTVDPEALPLSRFPTTAIVKDSPEHLAAISESTKRKEKTAAQEAVRKLETRKAVLEPLTKLLKPGATTEGFVGKRKMKIEVIKANPSGASWTIKTTNYDQFGKRLETHPADINEIVCEFDEATEQCVVIGTGGRTGALLGSNVTANEKNLMFSGGNLRDLIPKFTFD